MRGGSGASASNIDINGNGLVDTDDANVRSVPTRLTKNLPVLDKCNDTVQLTDTLSATGANYSDVSDPSDLLTGFPISSSGTYTLSAKVNGTGSVTNTVKLNGSDTFVTVQVPTGVIDPLTGLPVFETKQIVCCTGVALETSSSVDVTETTGFQPGQYCTATKGGYQTNNGGYPGTTIQNNFIPKFQSPGYMEIGLYNFLNGPSAPNGVRWTATSTGLTNLRAWINGGGTSGAFTTDLINPTATSGGTLAKQVATLKLNVAFSDGVLYPAGLGRLVYSNAGDSLNGFTVNQIVVTADNALVGLGLPFGYTFGSLNDLITNRNEAFDANLGFDSSTGK